MSEHIVEEEEVEYEEVPNPFIIETGDSVKVKQVFDDTICFVLTDKKHANYQANYSFDNKKFLLMFFACAAALIAQFYPMPFPDSRGLIFVCCAVYFIISFVLQLIQMFVDKDCILILYPKKDITSHETIVRTSFARFQEYFELILEKQSKNSKSSQSQTETKTTAKMYVGKYFTEAGEYDEESFTADLLLLLERYENQQYTTFNYDHKSD